MEKILVVVAGPTGVGKTAMSIRLATNLNTEVISADARQVFREMCIGTARPTTAELAAVPHHLIAHRSVADRYDAAIYAREAQVVLEDVLSRKSAAVLCGGSGLYIRALLEGFDEIPDVPAEIRLKTVADFESFGLEWLRQEVKKTDPDWFPQADTGNYRRLLRCLEVYRATGRPLSSFQTGKRNELPYEVIRIGLDMPRQDLYEKLDLRADRMFREGLWDEAESLFPLRHLQGLQTVGYREIFECLEGKTDRTEAVRLIKQNTRHYAKRQLTWFRRDPQFKWFSPEDEAGIMDLIRERRSGLRG